MSYRDLRNFSEAMRALGFPQPISLESFRKPNFALVEEIVRWLASRLDPDVAIGGGHATLEQRVALIRDAVGFFLSRANVKLNGRKMYGADGYAARELMKVAGLLRSAVESPPGDDAGQGADVALSTYDIGSRLSEIKQARQLATEITAQGSYIYELLAKEPEHKTLRDQALSRPLDMATMESCIRRALEAVTTRVMSTKELIDNVAASEAALEAKLERRRAELQRAEKRLHTVQKIKPAYQGELTALEADIETLWDQYVLRYRCVEALKHQLSVLESAQAEAAEEQQAAIMQLIHKYETEDVLGKLSDSDEDDSSEERQLQPRPATRPRTRLRIKTAGGPGAESRLAFGSMAAAARDSLDDVPDDLSPSDSEFSDKIGYGGDELPSRWSRAGARPRPATRVLTQGDDDFADLVQSAEGEGVDSLGSSDESELLLVGGPRRPSAAPPAPAARASAGISDNEF